MTIRPQIDFSPPTGWKLTGVILELIFKVISVVAFLVGVVWTSTAIVADHWDPQNVAQGAFLMFIGYIGARD